MQYTNISRVCINTGGLASSQDLHHFFSINHIMLRGYNIYYSGKPGLYALHEQYAHYDLVQSVLTAPSLLEQALKSLMGTQDFALPQNAYGVVILSCPFLFRQSKVLSKLHQSLTSLFPRADITYFVSFMPQYKEAEAYVAFMSLWSPTPLEWFMNVMADDQKFPLHYDVLLRNMAKLTGTAPRVSLCENGATALHDFLDFLNYPAVQLQEAGADFSAPTYRLENLPADFLCFSRYVNSLRRDPTPPQGVLPWSTQAPRFMPREGDPFSSLLGPQFRAKIHAQYEASNDALARFLGCQNIFTPPPADPDWLEMPELTPEAAFRVVQRLGRPFAQSLLHEFESEERPPAYVHYYCRDALQDRLHVSKPKNNLAPKVSVLTLAYNQESYISECIESVLSQSTAFPVEHIIVDDRSDDTTANIIAEYAKRYAQIKFIQTRTRWKGENVRALFGACRSEYAVLCDGDDYFTDVHKLQNQVDYLSEHPECSMCFHQVRVIYEDGSERERLYPPLEEMPRGVRPFYYLADLLKANFIQTNSVMYRWRFRDGLPDWFRSDLVPGDWYWHLLHAEMGKIGFSPDIMSVYRRHAKSLYYSSEDRTSSIPHRLLHGLKELEVYSTINQHFEGRYERALIGFANNVLVDFLKYARTTGDDKFLHEAGKRYPEFMAHFLKDVQIVRRTPPMN